MTPTNDNALHAAVPYAMLDAIRNVDWQDETADDSYNKELAAKRLGMSSTIAARIDEYLRLAMRDATVGSGDVAALAKLVARRPDSDLVFDDAGRRLARFVLRRKLRMLSGIPGRLPAPLRNLVNFKLLSHAASRVLHASFTRQNGGPVFSLRTAARDGMPREICMLYGAAITELLYAACGIEGALEHVSCELRGGGGGGGGDVGRWRPVESRTGAR